MTHNRFRNGSGCFKCANCGKKTRHTADNSNSDLCPKCYREAEQENAESDGGIVASKPKGLAATDWTGTIHHELLQIKGRHVRVGDPASLVRADSALREYMAQHDWSQADIDWAVPRVMGRKVGQTLEETVAVERKATPSRKVASAKPGLIEFNVRERVALKLIETNSNAWRVLQERVTMRKAPKGMAYKVSTPVSEREKCLMLVTDIKTCKGLDTGLINEACKRITEAIAQV